MFIRLSREEGFQARVGQRQGTFDLRWLSAYIEANGFWNDDWGRGLGNRYCSLYPF